MAVFNIQNQWGGNSAPWHEGGVLNIGNRVDQPLLALSIQSSDGGLSFTGTQTYQDEGPIGLRATRVTENTYHAENQWGGTSAPWHDAGVFLLGAREGQNAIAFDIASTDGETLTGTMTYAGEGPIGVKGVRSSGLAFDATNQWGGTSAPWHQGGQWVLGCRPDQSVTALDLTSTDDGKTVTGTMIYAGEGRSGSAVRASWPTPTLSTTNGVAMQHPGMPAAPGCLAVAASRGSSMSPWRAMASG